MTRQIAFYLPQFHAIPENDDWWGAGFTEWRNTQNARPLFDGHHQPRVPLNENYYSLLDGSTLRWQSDLMQQYGLDGLCFYHYRFERKLLLEKPAEILLSEKDIRMPFMFCWANESWTRTWEGDERSVLIGQSYGDLRCWREHIDYLLPFFRDFRYIKVDDRPVFLIYKSADIAGLSAMLQCWNQVLAAAKMGPIFFVDVLRLPWVKPHRLSDSSLKFEPFYSLFPRRSFLNMGRLLPVKIQSFLKDMFRQGYFGARPRGVRFDYDKVWQNILINSRDPSSLCSCFVDWDNTARRGEQSTVFMGADPRKFGKYYENLMKGLIARGDKFVFINAWNEWAEGAYLEPDTRHGLGYLEEIRRIKGK